MLEETVLRHLLLCLQYLLLQELFQKVEIVVDATRENVEVVTEFIDKQLSDRNVERRLIAKTNVAIDELYSNIAQYAYDGVKGKITVQVGLSDSSFSITFIDSGKPFNPLEKEDPDVSLGAEDRGIGGLGIFIVKNTMDDVHYEYTDNKNILTIVKNL